MNTTTPHEFTKEPTINLNIRRMLEVQYGVDHNLAEAITAAIASQDVSKLATKDDIKSTKDELKATKDELRIDIDGIKTEIQMLKLEMTLRFDSIMPKLIIAIFSSSGVLFGFMKILQLKGWW